MVVTEIQALDIAAIRAFRANDAEQCETIARQLEATHRDGDFERKYAARRARRYAKAIRDCNRRLDREVADCPCCS